MLLVHLETPDLRERVEPSILAADSEAVITEEWDSFLRRWPTAACVVVVTREVDRGLCSRLESARLSRPVPPLVLVLPASSEALTRLCSVSIDQVIDLHRVDAQLPHAIGAWLKRGFLGCVQLRIEAADVAEELRTALLAICAADPPYRSTNSFERSASLDRRCIARSITATKAGSLGLTLHDFVDAVFLIHGCRRWARLGNWQQVADTMGVEKATLRRRSGRLLGISLAEFNALGPAAAMGRIVGTVMLPFTEVP